MSASLQAGRLQPAAVLRDPAHFQTSGAEGLVDKVKGPKNPHPNRVAPEIEAAILDHALAHPTHGPMRVAHELALRGLQVSSGGVRGVWSRHDLLTKHERLLRLERATAERPSIGVCVQAGEYAMKQGDRAEHHPCACRQPWHLRRRRSCLAQPQVHRGSH